MDFEGDVLQMSHPFPPSPGGTKRPNPSLKFSQKPILFLELADEGGATPLGSVDRPTQRFQFFIFGQDVGAGSPAL